VTPDGENDVRGAPLTLVDRYSPGHLQLFGPEEKKRFLAGIAPETLETIEFDHQAWTRVCRHVAWELLYRAEPELYERLVAGESLHPGIINWLPANIETAVEVGAGTGRLTAPLAARCESLRAIEPAGPMRTRLRTKLRDLGLDHVEVTAGYFDTLPVPSGWAEVVVACSAWTPESAHGGVKALEEMERVCRPGGLIAVIWPPDPAPLKRAGFEEVEFPGKMEIEFCSPEEAVEMAEIFWPEASDQIRARANRFVPYDLVGATPPRSLCYKRVPA